MSTHDNPMMQAIAAAFPGSRIKYPNGGHAMNNPNSAETAAMIIAGQRGGEYVESIGTTDFANWTPHQWDMFVSVICGGYVDAIYQIETEAHFGVSKIKL